MKPLSTFDLDKIKIKGFIGAHAFDELPEKPDKDFSVIVNTAKGTKDGEHWVALRRTNSKWLFVDSFGRNQNGVLLSEEFASSMKHFMNGVVAYNHKLIQNLTSQACGYYCLYFINELNFKSLKACLKPFSEDFMKNDQYVFRYVKENILN